MLCNELSITDLVEIYLKCLDEIWEECCLDAPSDFLLGKIYGYVECLEEALKMIGVDYSELLAIEARYGIR